MTKKITIPYFPTGIKYASPLPLGAGVYLVFTGHAVWGALLILLSIVILSTHYVTEVDLGNKRFSDYLFFLGLQLNKDVSQFNTLHKIAITKGSYSQTLNTRVQSRQMDWSDYTATLLFDNNTLDLLTKTSKKELLQGLKEFSDFLHVEVEDRTTPQSYWIDMTKI